MEKQKAQEILNAARERGTIVCLYRSCYSNRFSAGFVLAISDHHVVIESVSPRGECDGWILRELDDLCRIDHSGRYEDKLLSFYRMRGQQHARDFLPETDGNSDLKLEMFVAARHHDYAVRIHTGADEDVEGFVKEVETNTVSIEKLDDYGQNDGECTFDMEVIEGITIGDDDLQDLKLLARWHDAPPLA